MQACASSTAETSPEASDFDVNSSVLVHQSLTLRLIKMHHDRFDLSLIELEDCSGLKAQLLFSSVRTPMSLCIMSRQRNR
ncbi:uncharacterized protein CCR75_006222 [Bremia lactucae]|uniref:Uncharacterized protein n=1 Tax=Bremia lactucae TaxID=4779 RepID=A0A976NZ24_BRELC|nr:hypothetical protein CCR75_006222 [Bremia lactucae]